MVLGDVQPADDGIHGILDGSAVDVGNGSKAQHPVSRNPSDKVKTLVLAVLVHPRDAKELVIPEPAKKEK